MEIENYQKVHMGQIKKADSRTNQYTEGLKSCFGLTFYNYDTKESYMFHYPEFVFHDLDSVLEKITKDFNNSHNVKVICTGAALSKEEDLFYNSEIIKDRVNIKNKLRDSFQKENINIFWNSFDEESSLYLDKEENKFVIKRSMHEDFILYL